VRVTCKCHLHNAERESWLIAIEIAGYLPVGVRQRI
jgi:hypothetical protein